MKVYCCGPQPLIDEIEAISGHWPEGRVIFEDFKPVEVVRADDKPFEVKLEKSGITIEVPADRSILEALRESGVPTAAPAVLARPGSSLGRSITGTWC